MSFPGTIVATNTLAGVLRVTGEDAFAYLQSQFTNDLRRPGVNSPATYGLWLTRKGRVAADSLVLRLAPEEFLLLSFHVPAEALETKVLENVIADDVASETVACSGVTVAGKGAPDTLVALGLSVPAPETFAVSGGLVVAASRRGGDSYEILSTDAAVFEAFAGRIRDEVTQECAAALEALRLAEGVVRVPEDCGPGDLPQEAGLDATAVSFVKGCYLGQEVMARLQSQGRPTRTLTRVTSDSLPSPEVGSKLFSGADESGEIRSRAIVEGRWMAMAMLKNRLSEGVESFSSDPGGIPSVTRLPSI